ncbi:MAG: hypothetical protein ACI9BW_003971, partial [Gammaproteobacteria bacterium]
NKVLIERPCSKTTSFMSLNLMPKLAKRYRHCSRATKSACKCMRVLKRLLELTYGKTMTEAG